MFIAHDHFLNPVIIKIREFQALSGRITVEVREIPNRFDSLGKCRTRVKAVNNQVSGEKRNSFHLSKLNSKENSKLKVFRLH